MSDKEETLKLQRPTDFLILETLEKDRNVAVNIAEEIDKSRSHINVRLPQLEDYGLVDKVGPAENSGLYEITDLGRLAISHRYKYDEVENFGEFLEEMKDSSTGN